MNHRARRIAGGAGACLVATVAIAGMAIGVVGAGAAGAGTDGTTPPFAIRTVDTTRFPKVTITAVAAGVTPGTAKISLNENGAPVRAFSAVPIAKAGTPVGVVLAVDISDSMKDLNRLALAKQAAKQFVSHLITGEQVALVSVGSTPTELTGFTSDPGVLSAAIDKLAPGGERAQWDGLSYAMGLFDGQPAMQRNVVLVTSGNDTLSKVDGTAVQEQAVSTDTAVFVDAVPDKGFDASSLGQLTSATGGQFLGNTDPNAVSQLLNSTGLALAGQYVISYTSKATTGSLDLSVSMGTLKARLAAVSLGTVTAGITQPQVVTPSGPAFLHGDTVKYGVAGLALLAAGLAAWVVLTLSVKEQSVLSQAIRPYDDQQPMDEDRADGRPSSLADTGFVQRAVDLTGRLAQERGLLEQVERKLEEANLPLRAAEGIFFWVAAVVILTLMGLFLKGVVGGLVLLVLSGALPWVALNTRVNMRRKKFTSQLPDMLQLLAGTLRAGYSLLQGVEATAEEVEDPMGFELRRVLGEARLGRPLEEALQDCADRMGSDDFSWAVMAIGIQREVGGNLSELLMTVSETMVARERLRRDVKALTAEGRISALVLGFLPVGLGVAMYAINPKYMGVLFHNSIGEVMLGGAVLLASFGFWWMKKTIEIEV